MRKKHLIIFIVYKHFDIIKTSFDSISQYRDADYFVVENISENSEEIQGFFRDKNLLGHIRFEENIANSAVTIFIRDYWELLLQYDYVTITDGDLFIPNIHEAFSEIFAAFQNPEVVVSSADLWKGNHYEIDDRKTINDYISDVKDNERDFGSVEGNTGGFLITLQYDHLYLIKDYLFSDMNLIQTVNAHRGRWFKTNKNLAYHLTWDLYYDGNPYYEWKKQVYTTIWNLEKTAPFTVIDHPRYFPKQRMYYRVLYEGKYYEMPNCRIKIDELGCVSKLIRDDRGKWKPVKAEVEFLQD